MKILEINKFYYLAGGTEKYMFLLSELFEKHGHSVVPFAMENKRNMPSMYSQYFVRPVNVRSFSFRDAVKTFYNADAVRQLHRLIKDEKPDIAHLHNIHHHLSPVIIRVLKKHGIPVVMTLHDYRLMCPNRQLFTKGRVCQRCIKGSYIHCVAGKCIQNSWSKSLLGAAESWFYGRFWNIYKQIDHFVAPSRFIKQLGVSSGLPADKITVLHNFIPLPTSLASDNIPTKPYLLYFGRLTPEKGVDVLLRALAAAKLDWPLKVIGGGPARPELEKLACDLGIEKRVDFVGPLYGDDLNRAITNSGAVVLPSRWFENMPYAMLEALALGKPVLGARSGGIPEIVREGENGYLFEPNNSLELSSVLDKLEEADLAAMGASARASVKRLDPEDHYLAISELFEKLTVK